MRKLFLKQNVFRAVSLAQFQTADADKGKQQADDPEARNDFGFVTVQFFKMMMQGRHEEDTFLAQPVACHLNDDRERLDDKDAADDSEQNFLFAD